MQKTHSSIKNLRCPQYAPNPFFQLDICVLSIHHTYSYLVTSVCTKSGYLSMHLIWLTQYAKNLIWLPQYAPEPLDIRGYLSMHETLPFHSISAMSEYVLSMTQWSSMRPNLVTSVCFLSVYLNMKQNLICLHQYAPKWLPQ